MSEVTTRLVRAAGEHKLVHTLIFPGTGGAPSGGITQAQADARYARLALRNQPGGFAGVNEDGMVDDAVLPDPDLVAIFESELGDIP